jgi:hypothetical protein
MDINRLTDYRVDDQENIMDIRTELLDPIVSSSYRYQFRLDTSSFLDKNTLLLFKPRATNGGDSDNLRLNCWNGGLGCIRAVEFQVGDFQVQRIEDINLWSSTNMLYNLPPDVQTKKLGHYLQNQLHYEATSSAGAGVSDLTGQVVPDNARSGINYGQSDDATGAAINSFKLNSSAASNEKIGIPLGMLLPMINDKELPLFLFTNYKVHITIEFESDASKFANDISKTNVAGNEYLAASDGEVSFSDVQMLVDYLVLPARVQNATLAETQKEGGFMIDFVNPLNIKKTSAAATANTDATYEHRINTINQEVHYIQQLKQMAIPGGATNFYNKVLLGQRVDGVALEELQINVNGVDIFTAGFVKNPVELYNNCSYALGRDLQVVKPLYMNDPATEASLLSPPQNGLLGKYKPLMLDLRNGEPTKRGGGRFIGEYPIRVIYKNKPQAATNTSWFSANNFEFAPAETRSIDYTYFVGTTRVLNVKTMPNGAQSVLISDM